MATIRNLTVSDIELNDLSGIILPASSDRDITEIPDSIVRASVDLATEIAAGNIVFLDVAGNPLSQSESENYLDNATNIISALTIQQNGVPIAGSPYNTLNFDDFVVIGDEGSGVATVQAIGTSSPVNTINQPGHGFTVGQPIYLDDTDDTWKLAQANAATTLGIAFADPIDTNNFNAVFSGKLGGFTGLSIGEYYFVSELTAGTLTDTEPAPPNYSNPMLHAISATEGIIIPIRPSRDEGTGGGSAGVDVQDSSTPVVAGATTINFGSNLTVTDDGGSQVTVDASGSSNAIEQGKHTIWLDAGSMVGKITGGADFTTEEIGTAQVVTPTYDFAPSVDESVQVRIGMPKSWNEGTITLSMKWTQNAAGSGNVVWSVRALSIGDGDSIDGTWGTAQTVTDAGGTVNGFFISAETPAITIGNSPAEGDMIVIEITRLGTSGSDTLGVDAKLVGAKVFHTINAATDA